MRSCWQSSPLGSLFLLCLLIAEAKCNWWRGRGGSSPLFDTNYTGRQQRRLLYDDGFATKRHDRWERIEEEEEAGLDTADAASEKSVCRFYVWNFPSALLHRWCHFLLKDCTYEGKGGVKFARIAPGSTLHFLWPCSKYSTDSCIICGGSYQDHLALSWRKHLHSPINEWLERTLETGSVEVPTTQGQGEPYFAGPAKRRNRRPASPKTLAGGRPGPRRLPTPTRPNYVFHRLYVSEKTQSDTKAEQRQNRKEQRQQQQKQQQKQPPRRSRVAQRKPTSNKSSASVRTRKKVTPSKPELEWREALVPSSQHQQEDQGPSIVYGVPTFSGRERAAKPMALSLAWFIVLEKLDDLIGLETMENNLKKKKTI